MTFAAGLAAGCYDPKPSSGARCAPGDLCPAGLQCLQGVCVTSSAELVDGPPLDAILDRPDAAPLSCPAGYVEVLPQVCHREVRESMSWIDAEHACERDGGHLVVPSSAAEAAVLPFPAWVGLSDRLVDGRFLTVTGRPPTFTMWTTDSPADSPFHCAHTVNGLRWVLGPCDFPFASVCEFDGAKADPTAF